MVIRDKLIKYDAHYDKKKLNTLAKGMNRKLGDMAAVIAIEELSELIQATSKWLRFDKNPTANKDNYNLDKINLCEEIADATIALHVLRNMAGISGAEVNQMIAYKIDRKQEILNHNKMIKK